MSSTEDANKTSRFRAIVHRRCPRRLVGPIYRRFFKPFERCPQCALVFEREPGYFLGSFYISYGFGAVVGLPTVLLVTYLDWSLGWLIPLVAA